MSLIKEGKESVLITGGSGFIGTSLTKRLSSLGHKVYIWDINHLQEECENVELLQLDISHKDESLVDWIKERNITKFVHLAAQTSTIVSNEDPNLDSRTNCLGIVNLMSYLRSLSKYHSNLKVVFSSSMTVYGNLNGGVVETTLCNPVSLYGFSKIYSEQVIKYFSQFGIDYSILRLFNVYGPGQDFKNIKQGMVSIYIAQLLLNRHVDVTGSLKRYRDFIYIDDVVDALLLAITDKRTSSKTLNVGSGKLTCVIDLLNLIIKNIEKVSSYKYKFSERDGHVGDTFGIYNGSKEFVNLGFSPKNKLEDKMFDTIIAAKTQLGIVDL